jgi:peptidoglycan/xylan/chitin deacetylase (PgdA/CDA1 family)/2-polyprenyl-3-methyl-5-hydroxy-6-metoxy-1,4-benzoquinol methylase
MMSDPLVSVVIPARDAEATIARTFECLLEQTDFRWEALVIDDGSVDATPAIIADHAARDSRFVALKSTGKGVSTARNVGLSRASGERILFLDSDDWIDPHFLAKMNTVLDGNPSAVAAYCDFCRVMPDGSETAVYAHPCIEQNPFETFARANATAIHGVLVKKSAVLKAGGFDPDLRTCEDWDLWQRIARTGGSWLHLNERLSYYRMSDHSLTQDVQQMLRDAHIVIARGYSNDARVTDPVPPHRDGAPTACGVGPTTAYAYFALWCAGLDCGRVGTCHLSQEILVDLPNTEASRDVIASDLLDAISVGIRATPARLAERWHQYGAGVTDLIAAIGRAWNDAKAARKVQYRFERMVLDHDDLAAPRRLTLTLGIKVDLRSLHTLRPPDGIDRLYVYLFDGPHILTLLDIGVLGVIDRDFWMNLVTGHLSHLCIEDKVEKPVRREIRIHKLTKHLRRFLRSKPDSHRHRRHALQTMMSRQTASLNCSGTATSGSGGSRGVKKSRAVTRESYWENFFEKEDPWNYGSPYEQRKYERQLEMLPSERAERALELACAEGHFTCQLAPKVGHLQASDISTKALGRARSRCRDHLNVNFVQLDLSADALPQAMDLIVCSEVLYYLKGEAELELIARRLVQALRPGGHLLTTHAFVLKDNMSRTGFDWENHYGAETIAGVMECIPELALEASMQTDLYRIDRFRRLHVGERAPDPSIAVVPVDARIEPEVARYILWDGAVARRAELAQSERRSHIPVLMYHRIATDGPDGLARYRLAPDSFQAQMLWLRRNGYHTINSGELAWFIANDHPFVGRPVLITFDDGYEDFAEHAWPILRAFDFSAEVFIVTDLVGKRAEWDVPFGPPAPLMSAARIAALAAEGVAFGSHLASHPRSDQLSTRELAEELTRSRAQLTKWLSRPVTSLAAPFGCTGQRLRILAAECGFMTLFNTASGAASLQDDPLDLPRMEIRGDCTLDEFVGAIEARL